MNVAIINVLGKTKSTGKIAYGLHTYLKRHRNRSVIYYGRWDEGDDGSESDVVRISSDLDNHMHAACARVFGNQGEYSASATKRLLRLLDEQDPDAVYLLNLHGYYLNFPMLFDYLGKHRIKTICLMLDEYFFLGKCANALDCVKYRKDCRGCPAVREYPKSLLLDRAHHLLVKKAAAYRKVPNITFVGIPYTVRCAKESFLLRDAHFVEMDEAIDLKTYFPRNTTSLRRELGIPKENKVILTIAPYSDPRKGGKYFMEAVRRLSDRTDMTFLYLVYDGDPTECPPSVIPIAYVRDQGLLATYYSLADMFVCPSLAETVANTCLEALACGTPVLGFDVCGMPDSADAEHGTFVPAGDVAALTEVIARTERKDAARINSCRAYAESRYDSEDYFKKLEQMAR